LIIKSLFVQHIRAPLDSPYLTLPLGWSGCDTCPALRLYQLGPMRIPKCNHKVTGNGHEAVDSCEAVVGHEAETGVKVED